MVGKTFPLISSESKDENNEGIKKDDSEFPNTCGGGGGSEDDDINDIFAVASVAVFCDGSVGVSDSLIVFEDGNRERNDGIDTRGDNGIGDKPGGDDKQSHASSLLSESLLLTKTLLFCSNIFFLQL
jgi:hypothetical protein